jgi:DNA-binding NarL/FixJ family response regulator
MLAAPPTTDPVEGLLLYVASLAPGDGESDFEAQTRLLDLAQARLRGKCEDRVLTPREWEIALLVARGMTNPQIADALVISRGTVMVHLKHIMRRLGMTSRAQVAAWVVSQ